MRKTRLFTCPQCGGELRLFGVERHPIIGHMQIRTYECVTCNIVQTDLTPLQTLGSRTRKPDLLANCGFDDEFDEFLGLRSTTLGSD